MIPIDKETTWFDRLVKSLAAAATEGVAQLVPSTEFSATHVRQAIETNLRDPLYDGLQDFDVKIDTACGKFEGSHWAINHMAQSFGESLDEYGGPSYVELSLFDPVGARWLVVTVRKKEGRTPGEVAAEAQDIVSRLVQLAERIPASQLCDDDRAFLTSARTIGAARDALNAEKRPKADAARKASQQRWSRWRRFKSMLRWVWSSDG